MEILETLSDRKTWDAFIQYKTERQHLSPKEKEMLDQYLGADSFWAMVKELQQPDRSIPVPVKHYINKDGVKRKRVVYSYEEEEFVWILKCITYCLYRYDSRFAPNCYAFRRDYGVGNAMQRIRKTGKLSCKYCLKVDIHDYFNSISPRLLLEQLSFLNEQDAGLYRLFKDMLTDTRVKDIDGVVKKEEHKGAMAGVPVASFFANVYLSDVDWYFEKQDVLYYRYSDDILIFADSREELSKLQEALYSRIDEHGLLLNPDKVSITRPGQTWEFLGFCYRDGKIDLSEHTKYKIKGKIKRKAHALRSWQRKKGLSGDKACKGFIRAMNHKFYGFEEEDSFSWNRWFFPNLTTTDGLKEIDAYMQQYIRYCMTGRHYKGNFRIRYEQLKQWGYRSLVAEYYKRKKEVKQECGMKKL